MTVHQKEHILGSQRLSKEQHCPQTSNLIFDTICSKCNCKYFWQMRMKIKGMFVMDRVTNNLSYWEIMIQSPDCSLSPESDLIPLGLHSMEIGSTHSEVRKYIFIGPWSIYSGSGLNMYCSHTGDNNQPVHCDYLSLMIPFQLSNHIKSNLANIKCEWCCRRMSCEVW